MSNEFGFVKHVRKMLAHLANEYQIKLSVADLDAITDCMRQIIEREPATAALDTKHVLSGMADGFAGD